MKKVMFISSTGGHLDELLQLKKMFDKYDYYIVTEKTKSNLSLKEKYKIMCFDSLLTDHMKENFSGLIDERCAILS